MKFLSGEENTGDISVCQKEIATLGKRAVEWKYWKVGEEVTAVLNKTAEEE